MKDTATTINSMFAKRKRSEAAGAARLKPIYCEDGVSMSVQASREHSCFPKNDEGPYSSVEVGFPSVCPPQAWAQYCKGNFDLKPCDTIYRNVPLKLVVAWIESHGGVRATEAPKLVLPTPSAPIQRVGIAQKRYNLTLEDLGFKVA